VSIEVNGKEVRNMPFIGLIVGLILLVILLKLVGLW